MRAVSLMTANQEFSKLIKEVEHGSRFLITRRGRPIAMLVPHTAEKTIDPEWARAYERMTARLDEGASLGGLRIERDDLYERKGRFSLDTNILVYAVDRDAGERHEQSKEIMARAARRDSVLTIQALTEFFRATTRKNLLEPSRASVFVRDWLEVFHVTAADATALIEAMEAVEEHRLSFWDAMLWATARQIACSAILSEDMQDGRRLRGVEFVNPFAANAAARLAWLLEA